MAGSFTIKFEEIEKAHLAYVRHEPRDLFYRAATELVTLAINKNTSLSVTEALAVLLQTWNRAYFRFHPADRTKCFSKLECLYQKYAIALVSYRRRTIETLAETERSTVCKLFTQFENVLGAVGAAKVLHLLAPRFFPLWDRAIARAYDNSLGKKGTNGTRYWRFMGIARSQYLPLKGKCSDILKRIDEYNYVKFTLARSAGSRRGVTGGRYAPSSRGGRAVELLWS